MSAVVEREYVTVHITAQREPDHRSRTEVFEIHVKDIGCTTGVTVVWECMARHFRPRTGHASRAVELTSQALCEAMDEAVSEGGSMTIAAFWNTFKAVCDRHNFMAWDGQPIETSIEVGFA